MQNEITVVSSFFTKVPDNSGTQDQIQIILSNGNSLDLTIGDCLKVPTTNGIMTKKIREFRPADPSEDITAGETECASIRFTDGRKIQRKDFDTMGLQRIDCVNAMASALRPNRRKTRKPTKKVRRNRRANSRRN